MSEKRFEFHSDDYFVGIMDNRNGKKLNILGSIGLLNQLYDENERLKADIERIVNRQYSIKKIRYTTTEGDRV